METGAKTNVLASRLADLLEISETGEAYQCQCGREMDG